MREGELKGLDAAALTQRLKGKLDAVGALALDGERELARELVRRARREERLCALLAELLVAGDALVEGGVEDWKAAAAKVRKALKGQ